MARHHVSVLILGLCLWMLAWPSLLLAYPVPMDFQGRLLRWDISREAPTVTYEVTGEPADVAAFRAHVDAAARLWSEVPGSYVRYVAAQADEEAMTTLHLARSFNGSEESAGYAIFDQYNGDKPSHCKIEVDVDDTIGFYAFSKTVLHELGHCLGLGHTLMPKAIMSYYVEENAFALDTDDKAAIARLYPEDGSHPKLPPGCAIGAQVSGNNRWFVLWCVIALPLGGAFSGRFVTYATRRHRPRDQ